MADAGSEHTRRFTSRAWWFRDRHTGETVVAQFPNLPLWIFLASVVARAFLAEDTSADSAVAWIGTGALTWWALDEVIRGVNPWRRVLGVGGCAYAVVRVVQLLG